MRDRLVLFTSLVAFTGLAYVACSSPPTAGRRDAATDPDAFVEPDEDAAAPGVDAASPSEDAAMPDDAPTSGA
ncbi:MAG: hypothetical protein OHK0013_19850 [Sandaracinaceae bacterium]